MRSALDAMNKNVYAEKYVGLTIRNFAPGGPRPVELGTTQIKTRSKRESGSRSKGYLVTTLPRCWHAKATPAASAGDLSNKRRASITAISPDWSAVFSALPATGASANSATT